MAYDYRFDIGNLRQPNIFGGMPEPIQGVDFGMSNLPIMQSAPRAPAPQASSLGLGQNPFGTFDPGIPNQATPAMGPQVSPRAVDPYGIIDYVNRLYDPETEATERYNTLLNNYPERNDPSIWQKLVAAGMGWGAKDPIQTMENAMYAPYNREVADWSTQVGPYQQAASLENARNVNERTLAANLGTNLVNQQRYADQFELGQQKNEIAAAKTMGAKFLTSGNRIMAMFPDGRPAVDMGPTTNFSPFELESLRQTGRMELGQQQNQGRLDVTRQQGVNQAAAAAARPGQLYQDPAGNVYQFNGVTDSWQPVGTAPPQPTGPVNTITGPQRPTAPGAGQTAAQARMEQNERFSQVFNTYDFAQRWLIPPKTANDTWKMVDAPIDDPDAMAEYNEVRSLLGIPMAGGELPPRPRRSTDIPLGAAPPAPAEARPIPQGYAEMRDPSGRLGLMRIENVAAAQAQGWTRTR